MAWRDVKVNYDLQQWDIGDVMALLTLFRFVEFFPASKSLMQIFAKWRDEKNVDIYTASKLKHHQNIPIEN